MIGNHQYCNKYGCDWVVHHHVEDEYMGKLTVYECRRCGARQAKWCKKHEHDWQPVSTEGASMAMVKCKICGEYQYRL